jgi:hypothetical protein
MARTKKSSKKRNARAADLPVNRKKASNVKGGWTIAAIYGVTAARAKAASEKQHEAD